jgi:small conductance mechanosensitive channel
MGENVVQNAVNLVTVYGMQVVGAIVILVVGRFASGALGGAARKAMERANVDVALVGFVSSAVRIAVLAFAVIAALAKFGIQTTSFVAILGAAGLAIGLALQGSLANFASGVLILVFRPFKIGDVIAAGGATGKVVDISIFTTTMTTPDNQKIIVPNAAISSGTITNVNAYETRRVDLKVGIGYGDDIAKAQAVLKQLCERHPKILKDPEPAIELVELGSSSVNFAVRPWVKTEDYWRVYSDVTRSVKEEFDRNGISIPFPQQDVHVHQVSSN